MYEHMLRCTRVWIHITLICVKIRKEGYTLNKYDLLLGGMERKTEPRVGESKGVIGSVKSYFLCLKRPKMNVIKCC